jgi:hypothetical protein
VASTADKDDCLIALIPLDAITLGEHQRATVSIQPNRVDQAIAQGNVLVVGTGPVQREILLHLL